MKKKWLVMLAAMAALCSVLAGGALATGKHDGETHSYLCSGTLHYFRCEIQSNDYHSNKYICDRCGVDVVFMDEYESHRDDGRDHICDVCGGSVGTHEAAPGTHICDYCGEKTSDCADGDKNHACDVCGARMGTHEAAPGGHICDYCGKKASECVDENRDHACEVCGAAMGTHEAAPGGHICDYCGMRASECVDENRDHACDACGASMGTHEAAAGGHICGYCGKKASECVDENRDHACDVCGAVLSEHSYSAIVTKKADCTHDGVITYTCECGDTYRRGISALNHWFGLWQNDQTGVHTAECRRGCGYIGTANCAAYEVTATVGETETVLNVCPVCGAFGETAFAVVEDAAIEAVGAAALPKGEAIVRGLSAPFEGALYAFTAAYEYAGEVMPFAGSVSVTLPVDESIGAFRLVRVDVEPATEAAERSEVWTELEFTFEDGKLSFETDAAGLFLLVPAE